MHPEELTRFPKLALTVEEILAERKARDKAVMRRVVDRHFGSGSHTSRADMDAALERAKDVNTETIP